MGCLAASAAPLAVLLATAAASTATGADRVILGSRFEVSDSRGTEERRRVVAVGKERPSDVPSLSDPTDGGALLTIAIDGATSTSQSYVLDAEGWAASGATGYRYAGPTGADGDPVKKLVLRRRADGTVLIKLTVRGNVGTQSLDLVPPDPGVQASVVLDVAGGDRYCTTLGGAAGGTVRKDTSQAWKLVAGTAEVGCPTTTTTSTSTTTTTSTTAPAVCGNGIVEFPPETCESSEECLPALPGVAACGAPGGPAECQCCLLPGQTIECLLGPPPCCDGSPTMMPGPFICECPP